jgi:hypothetical protein
MKRVLFMSVVMSLAIISSAYPNSPSDIKITVNARTVDIKVLHPVSDPSAHYVKTIVTKVNGAEVFRDKFTSQTGDYQDLTREIPALKKGDILAITAYCSLYGDLTKEAVAE